MSRTLILALALSTAGLMASPATAATTTIAFTDTHPITETCKQLAQPLNTGDTTRILCDCEPRNAMCWGWDANGNITGSEREMDHAKNGVLTLLGLGATVGIVP